MSKRLVKYSLVAGLALLLALPAVAYSQRNAPGPRFGAGEQGGFGPGPELGFAGQRGFDNGPRGPRFGAPEQRANGVGRGAFAGSQRGGRGAGLGPGGRGLTARALAHADEIGLSAEQRDGILAQRREAAEAAINRRADMQVAALELRDLMDAESRDLGAIEAKLRELAEQRISAEMAVLRGDEAVREVLSAEQIATLDELRPERGHDRPGAGPRGRGPRRNIR